MSQPPDQHSLSGLLIPSGTWKKFPVPHTPDRQRLHRPAGAPATISTGISSSQQRLRQALNRSQQLRTNLLSSAGDDKLNRNGDGGLPKYPQTISKIRLGQSSGRPPGSANRSKRRDADDSYFGPAKRRLANYSFDANQSFPASSRRSAVTRSLRPAAAFNSSGRGRHDISLITPPVRPQIRHRDHRHYLSGAMDTIRVDGANGLRFSARRKGGGGGGGGGCLTPGHGSPFGEKSSLYLGALNNSSLASAGTSYQQQPQSHVHLLHHPSPAGLGLANSSVTALHSASANTTAIGIGCGGGGGGGPPAGINPHKAVFTIDSHTSRILIVNHNACTLLGYTSHELCGMQFSELLAPSRSAAAAAQQNSSTASSASTAALKPQPNRSHVSALAEGQLNSDDGTMVLLSGKVVEMCTKEPAGGRVAVSLWIRQIDADGRCLAVAEPVERRVARLQIDRNGAILCGDTEAVLLFQLDGGEQQFVGMDVQQLIPAIVLPDADSSVIAKHVRKQKATGRTADGVAFPLCLMLAMPTEAAVVQLPAGSTSVASAQSGSGEGVGGGGGGGNSTTSASTSASTVESGDSGVSNSAGVYSLTIWVFQNLSGLVVMDERGVIESCNHHFSMLMFGYAQMKMLGRHITDLIPNFGADLEYVPVGEAERSRNESSMDEADGEGDDDDDLVVEDDEGVDDGDDEGGADGYDTDETETDPVYYENEGFVMSEGAAGVLRPLPMVNLSGLGQGQLVVVDDSLQKTRSEPVNISLETDRETPQCRRAVCQQHLDQSASFLADGDSPVGDVLRTPVNETPIALVTGVALPEAAQFSRPVTPQTAATTSRAYQLADISEALRAVDTSLIVPADGANETGGATSVAGNGMLDSPKFNPQQTDAGKLRLKLMTSTPAPDVRRDTERLVAAASAAVTGDTSLLAANASVTATTTPTPTGHQSFAPLPVPPAPTPARFSSYDHTDGGKFRGLAVHYDGNVFDIIYSVSRQTLPCGRRCFCVWICRDPEQEYDELHADRSLAVGGGAGAGGGGDFGGAGGDDDDGRLANLSLTFNSICSSTVENSLGQAIKQTAAQNSASRPASVSLMSQCEEDQCGGEFHRNYTALRQIGKGAYGYVKLAYRHSDRLLVVTKFIRKDKLTPQTMILTEDKRAIPMEIYLLTTVKHPNIVQVWDVYENERFFQMVMEKHGSGMDLFEFIDRQPLMDERLACYIFRQIVDAVDYLHSLNILHRDIKDENIIIDQNFHVKLIDFGSATFMEEGKLFSTFYGTTEYCSPEVLAGNKYAGPELEMWSLGVTLYVLLVFENPFLDIEETLRAELVVPVGICKPLETLLRSMLDKDPQQRCTMRQLKQNTWLQQEIAPGSFSFGWVVSCDAQEANPEQYFAGPVYSSATALSTMSAHDSLSLVDDDAAGLGGDLGAGAGAAAGDGRRRRAKAGDGDGSASAADGQGVEDDDGEQDSIIDVESEDMMQDDEVVEGVAFVEDEVQFEVVDGNLLRAGENRVVCVQEPAAEVGVKGDDEADYYGQDDEDDEDDDHSQMSQGDKYCTKCNSRNACPCYRIYKSPPTPPREQPNSAAGKSRDLLSSDEYDSDDWASRDGDDVDDDDDAVVDAGAEEADGQT